MNTLQELAEEPVLVESEWSPSQSQSVPVVHLDSEWSPIGKVGECKDLACVTQPLLTHSISQQQNTQWRLGVRPTTVKHHQRMHFEWRQFVEHILKPSHSQ